MNVSRSPAIANVAVLASDTLANTVCTTVGLRKPPIVVYHSELLVTVRAGSTLHFRYLAEGGVWFDDETVDAQHGPNAVITL